ncbi:oligosaccharide flippase family protein [bacterium]|nr:oligosaccharide flippase family protein [candidate division CSSED10-310 bacterium]
MSRDRTLSDDRGMVRAGMALFFANAGFALLTFILNFIVARRLGPAGYGVFGTVTALLFLFSALFPSLVMAVARVVAADGGTPPGTLRGITYWSLAAAAMLIALAGPLQAYLRLPRRDHLYLVAGFLFLSALLSALRGVLEGLQRFYMLALNIAGEGIFRLLTGGVLLVLGYEIGGVLLAYLLATIGAIGLFLPARSRGLTAAPAVGRQRHALARFFLPVLLTHVLIELLTNLDMVMIRHGLSEMATGRYTVLFTAGKFMLFGAGAAATVMFPKVVTAAAGRQRTAPVFHQGMLLTLGLGAGLTAGAWWFGAPVIGVLFGPEFTGAAPLLAPYCLLMTLFCLAFYGFKVMLAIGRYRFLILPAAAVLIETLLLRDVSSGLSAAITRLSWLAGGMTAIILVWTGIAVHRLDHPGAREGA